MTPIESPRLRGLWLSKELPFPLDAGDRVYSGHLARALAEAGHDVTFVGFAPDAGTALPPGWPLAWEPVAGRRGSPLASLFSRLPLVAASHATPRYRQTVAALAGRQWDFVVVDNYAMGWALPMFRRGGGPVLLFVAHDHAEALTRSIYREYGGSWPKRLALWLNHLKTRRLERRVVRSVDALTVITAGDAAAFGRIAPAADIVQLEPGFTGHVEAERSIGPSTPRRVVMVGSFLWVAKQENLRRFLRAADAAFQTCGIEFHVLGKMPAALKEEIETTTRATVLHGYVADVAPLFRSARLAVVPELIGGGFKMKILDYVFGRVPVATLRRATAGLPPALTDAMLCEDDLEPLVASICAAFDCTEQLDAMQRRAWDAAQPLFRWQDRGAALSAAIRRHARPAAAGHAAPALSAVPGPRT